MHNFLVRDDYISLVIRLRRITCEIIERQKKLEKKNKRRNKKSYDLHQSKQLFPYPLTLSQPYYTQKPVRAVSSKIRRRFSKLTVRPLLILSLTVE